MDRRSFLRFKREPRTADKAAFQQVKVAPRPPLSGLDPYDGPWDTEQVVHLLRRTMFGAKNSDVNYIKTLTLQDAVELLLTDLPAPPPPVNDYDNGDDVVDAGVPTGETWINAEYNGEVEWWRTMSLKCWWMGHMLHQQPNLTEKMTLFWHNHIPVQMWPIFDGRYSYKYLAMMRANCLGNFKTLIREVTLDPAMLFYLNGVYNEVGAPDENYGRELQELFCIGKGPGSQYTEEDVQAAARVLTGWKAEWDYPNTYFAAWAHDTNDKQFSAFYGNTVIEGKEGEEGATELDEMLDMIFATQETALYLCRKLYTYFVYHVIDDQTETNVIEPLAQIFRDNNYEIKPVLRALFNSQHFFDSLNRGAMLKSPLDLVIGMARENHVVFPDLSDYKETFWSKFSMYWWLYDMLQDPGDPPNVAGWPAYYQSPAFYKYWISTSTLPRRGQHADNLIYWGYGTDNGVYGMDVVQFVATLQSPADPNTLIDEVLKNYYMIDVSDEVKLFLKSILLSGQQSDYYWTIAWEDYVDNPGNQMAYFTVESRLQPFFHFVFQLEEFQLH